MRAGASIAKEIVRRIDELFAIERVSLFADPGESVNRFGNRVRHRNRRSPDLQPLRPSLTQSAGLSWPAASLPKHDLTASRAPTPRRLLRAARAIGLPALSAMRRRLLP